MVRLNSKDYNNKWRNKKRREAEEVFGRECKLCHGKVNLCYHKKDGKPHIHWLACILALKNPNDWVRLCYPCHKSVHWCMKHFKMSWEEIIEKFL